MRAATSLSLRALRSLSFPSPLSHSTLRVRTTRHLSLSASTTSIDHLEREGPSTQPHDSFHVSDAFDSALSDLRSLPQPPSCEVMQLEDLPEQWRRSRLAWLCKELPAHKPATVIRILNGQRKWMMQEDATYVVVHCLRIRENETAFRVYKWMIQRHWFRFDFALATKLAEYLGKERKFAKCRELFDQIINQGQVPSESTFHILIVAYLSAPIEGCLEEACAIYNRMIQLGGYKPRLSLHNSLFRALVGKPGASLKSYLKQAEFIFHNLVTSELEIHKEIYAGLIWLHSYQDIIDRERIAALREDMHQAGVQEGVDVLVSVMRACAKQGDVEEAEKTWVKLLESGGKVPSQAFVYRMDLYEKAGELMKSLEVFRKMQEQVESTSAVAYQKIIEIMSRAQEVKIAEMLMSEFIESGLKPTLPSFIDVMTMYFSLDLHDKLEWTFHQCLLKNRPNRSVCSIYLDSLVKTGYLDKAEKIFNEMQTNGAIGVHSKSCNVILGGYLASGQFVKAEKIYDMMCQKKYDIESALMEKMEYVLSLSRKVVKKPISMKLDKEQREILMGLLLGGVQIESDEKRRNHAVYFQFNENSDVHRVLKIHIHEQYYEWLNSLSKPSDENDDIPHRFSTISHSYFGFFADQFWPKGRPMVPKLIHRWLSPRVLAYWYMYGGLRTASGDILLKLKDVCRDDVEKVVKALKTKSLDSRVKRKGKVFWIGFQGSNAAWFWKLTEPYVLVDLKDPLKVDDQILMNQGAGQHIDFNSESDSDDHASDSSEGENSFGCFQNDTAGETHN
ncbi:hypothetical protein AAC387_Pa03g0433 [Persea americana]